MKQKRATEVDEKTATDFDLISAIAHRQMGNEDQETKRRSRRWEEREAEGKEDQTENLCRIATVLLRCSTKRLRRD